MQDSANVNVAILENQLTERFGLLMSHTQLAELLGRSGGESDMGAVRDSGGAEFPESGPSRICDER